MTELEEGRLLRDCRWLCIQTEQCVSRRLAPMDITAVQAHILLFLLWHGEKGTLLTDIHRAFGYSIPCPAWSSGCGRRAISGPSTA